MLDFAFTMAYLNAILFIIGVTIDGHSSMSEGVLYSIIVIALLPVIAYHFICEALFGGRSLGKMIARIKVTNIDGSIPSLGAYFLRWVLRLIDNLVFFGAIGALFIKFTPYHQRLGDLAAGTIVIRTNPLLRWNLNDSFYEFADDYQPTFQNVTQLTEGQIIFITNLLTESRNDDVVNISIRELDEKVKEILQIDSPEIRRTMSQRVFLETIVRDYNYYALVQV
jgi:uncharacterized RDD family membrane protein YckC